MFSSDKDRIYIRNLTSAPRDALQYVNSEAKRKGQVLTRDRDETESVNHSLSKLFTI